MAHRFSLKEIAFQSGLSLATVDRVLHGREGVRASTQARVAAALAELDRQQAEARVSGRRLGLDVVIEAPRRFSSAVKAAFESELSAIRPASITARFHLAERMEQDDLAATLRAVRRRGSHGVILKARDTRATAELSSGLMQAGIPVVTLVTDIAPKARLAYVGIDNEVAGANAAYLLGRMTAQPAKVLVSLSSQSFAGEEGRALGFSRTIRRDHPHLTAVTVSEGGGVDRSTYDLTMAALESHPDMDCVYSIGGGNEAILQAFFDSARTCRAFIAHDLDATNRRLLGQGRISIVIHHDLRQDVRAACQWVLRHHRMLPADLDIAASRMMLLTPHDLLDGL